VKGGLDTCVGSCVSPTFPVTDGACSDYGIAIDARNRVYIQSSSCRTALLGSYHKVWQFPPNATYTGGTYRAAMLPWVNQGRGVTVQVWKESVDPTHILEHSRMWVTNYDQWAWGDWQKSYASSFDGDKLACDANMDGVTDASCDYNGDGIVNWKDYDAV